MTTHVGAKEDLTEPRNLAIIFLILITGIGSMSFSASAFTKKRICLAGIFGLFSTFPIPTKNQRQKSYHAP
jgi:uracil permease